MTVPSSPYKGLMPYSEEDAPFFFGREAEKEIITANLMASRLTVLYGASGVGKSSVLRAGVEHHLRELTKQNVAERGAPEFAVVVFRSWRDDPVAMLEEQISESLTPLPIQADQVELQHDGRRRMRLAEFLESWTRRIGSDVLIILDQFEEYFLYHGQEDGEGTFAVEFPRAVNRPDVRASFLISIREDSLAKLDRFKGRIPNMFDNYLRIDHLDREAARDAIVRPIEKCNQLQTGGGKPITLEPALVEAILDQVRTGQVVFGEAGRGVIVTEAGTNDAEARIETPYLQLVMTRLWEEEMRAGSPVLRRETLDRLGGAEQIVRTHLDAVMNALPGEEQEAAARVFHFLVTPSGTKIAHTVPDLAEYAQLPEARLATVLEKLSDAGVRILRPVVPPPDRPTDLRYEIFHDVLAAAILDWRRRYAERQAQERIRREEEARREQERAEAARLERARRLRLSIGVLALLLPLVAGLATWAYMKHRDAQKAREESKRDSQTAREQRAYAEDERRQAQAAREETTRERERTEIALDLVSQAARKDPALVASLVKSVDATKLPPNLYIQIQNGSHKALAQQLARKLKENGVVVFEIELVDRNVRTSEVRFFHASEAEEANRLADMLRTFGLANVEAKRIVGLKNSPRVQLRQYELWIGHDVGDRSEVKPAVKAYEQRR